MEGGDVTCHPRERTARQGLPGPESGASPEVGQKEGQAGEAAAKGRCGGGNDCKPLW